MKRNQRLIVILSILLVVGFLTTSLASFFVSRESLSTQISRNALPLTSDNIYSEIQRDLLLPIYISSMMATDTFLRDWVIGGEQDSTRIIRYLKDIQKKYGTFTSFFVSERTRIYYQAEGVLKRVAPDEPRDEWYFRVRTMDDDYEINVDPDMAHDDTMTIFVNYRVYDYDGTYIGATGVGLAVTAVKRLIESYQQKYGRVIFFVDRHGEVTLHGSSFPEHITNIRERESLAPHLKDIFGNENRSIEYRYNGSTTYLNTRYIPEFDWYLFVEQSGENVMRGILTTLLINLLICLVITMVVVSITYVTVNSYQRIMETMAATDSLTGFYNRRTFDVILDQTIRDVLRNGGTFSLVLFDIDHFKKVNDTHGHLAGDSIISRVAGLSRGRLRDSDVCCRWGGEEFILLLKNCGLEDAAAMAESIRTMIETSPMVYEGREIPVTVSLGVTQYECRESKDVLLSRADETMYCAKRNGRNRVETG